MPEQTERAGPSSQDKFTSWNSRPFRVQAHLSAMLPFPHTWSEKATWATRGLVWKLSLCVRNGLRNFTVLVFDVPHRLRS